LLSGEAVGEGTHVVLLHGLTATRRYVVMGSRLLERSGYRRIAFDARGHGRSAPAPASSDYTYGDLSADLESVLDALDVAQAILAGASMGAHTAVRFALAHPERALALCLITPSYLPGQARDERALAAWDALARGLREEGVEGFVHAYDLDSVPPRWRETIERVLRQRLAAHEHPAAVADALEAVPRSRPFEDLAQLATIRAPTVIVGSGDEPDPGHPLAVAQSYAEAITGARLVVEREGSPLAWQGGAVSRLIAELGAQAAAGAERPPGGHT
jgi:pimeloyl-ACP methyl ester carboxylesterase